jgi:hypothetical protein
VEVDLVTPEDTPVGTPAAVIVDLTDSPAAAAAPASSPEVATDFQPVGGAAQPSELPEPRCVGGSGQHLMRSINAALREAGARSGSGGSSAPNRSSAPVASSSGQPPQPSANILGKRRAYSQPEQQQRPAKTPYQPPPTADPGWWKNPIPSDFQPPPSAAERAAERSPAQPPAGYHPPPHGMANEEGGEAAVARMRSDAAAALDNEERGFNREVCS